MKTLHARRVNVVCYSRAVWTGSVLIGGLAAMNAGAAAPELEEVVVTAQFRETKLQDTPIAITALSADMMDARGQTTVSDIAAQAPNVLLQPASSLYGPAVTAYIRGVGQVDTSFALEPGIGMYIDDVYFSTVLGSDFELLDLERVEILRGPQGTLAGKNSIGGAVKLYSRKPSAETAGVLEATYGSQQRHDFKAAGNVTLIPDQMYLRLSGVSKSSEGYVDRLDYACTHPGSSVPTSVTTGDGCKLGTLGGRDVQAMRAQLRWTPTENLDIDLAADITDDKSEAVPTLVVAMPGVNVPGTPYQLTNGTAADASFIPSDPYINYSTYCATTANNAINANTAGFNSFCVSNHNDFQARGGSARVEWRLGPTLVLTSITGYRSYRSEFGDDGDAGPFDYQTNYNKFTNRQFSEELRLGGAAFGGKLDWTVGGYYFDGAARIGGRIHIPNNFDFTPNDPVDSSNKSGFVHGAWHVTDAFNVTAGYRYTKDEKDYTFSRFSSINPGTVPTSLIPIHGLQSHYSGSHSDYKLALDYRWSPQLMTYAQVSTGFRGGGVNPRPLAGNQGTTFRPETLTAYEIGAKTDLLNNALRLNLSLFLNKYKDILFTATGRYFNPNMAVNEDPSDPLYNPANGTFPAAVPTNAGAATFKGVELETQWSPVTGLAIDASGSWIDFKMDSVSRNVNISLNTDWIYTPKWKASAGAQYEMPVGAAGSTLTPRIDYNYQSSVAVRIPITTYGTLPGYRIANARLTWRSASKAWESSLAVTNLLDKVYFTNGTDLTGIGGIATRSVAPPRQWALSVKRTFD